LAADLQITNAADSDLDLRFLFGDDTQLGRVVHTFVHHRSAARIAKDFALADKIRQRLSALGITLKDNPDGTTEALLG